MTTARQPPAPYQTGAAVWRGCNLQDSRQWSWRWTAREIEELLAAAEPYCEASDAELTGLTPNDFPLPSIGPKLVALRRQLTHGRGFELVRGFPVDDLTGGQCQAVFAGIGSHLGGLRSQNEAGDLLGQVRNVGADATDPNVRIYQTNERQSFHTDSADVVGLLCLRTGATGGDSLLVSAATIYNEMLRTDKDLAAVLFQPIATDRRGEVPPGALPFFTIPVLTWYANALTVMYQRQYIQSAQRFADAPRLTKEVIEALDLFDEIANDPQLHLHMRLEVGDMQFVHNHSMLHDRTAFTDRPEAPRHLLRLWLSVPGDRALPPVFAQRFGSVVVGDRGGIVVG